MELNNKSFSINNEVKKVINTDEAFAYFEDGARIKKEILITKYEEVMDPVSLFGTASGVESIANTIKNFDTSKISENVNTQQKVVEINNDLNTIENNNSQEVEVIHKGVTPVKDDGFFSKIKRNTTIEIDFSIEEKFPDLEFVKMMNDNYETSIIDHFASEIVEKIVFDPTTLLESVKKRLNILVYGEKIDENIKEKEDGQEDSNEDTDTDK